MMRKYTILTRNIILESGLLTGLTIRYLQLFNQDGIKLFSIPLYPCGFDRKLGLEMREMEARMVELRNKGKKL